MNRALGAVTHRSVLAIAVPIMLSNVSEPLIGVVDTAVIGRLPEAYFIGAIAIGSLIFSFVYWGFGFLRLGTSGLAAQAYGSGDQRELTAVLFRALLVSRRLRSRPDRSRPADREGSRRIHPGLGRGRTPCGSLFPHPHLVGAVRAREFRRAGLADRPGPRRTGARPATLPEPLQYGARCAVRAALQHDIGRRGAGNADRRDQRRVPRICGDRSGAEAARPQARPRR